MPLSQKPSFSGFLTHHEYILGYCRAVLMNIGFCNGWYSGGTSSPWNFIG